MRGWGVNEIIQIRWALLSRGWGTISQKPKIIKIYERRNWGITCQRVFMLILK